MFIMPFCLYLFIIHWRWGSMLFFLIKELVKKCVCFYLLFFFSFFVNEYGEVQYLGAFFVIVKGASRFCNSLASWPTIPLGQGCGKEALLLINIGTKCWGHVVWYGPGLVRGGCALLAPLPWCARLHTQIGDWFGFLRGALCFFMYFFFFCGIWYGIGSLFVFWVFFRFLLRVALKFKLDLTKHGMKYKGIPKLFSFLNYPCCFVYRAGYMRPLNQCGQMMLLVARDIVGASSICFPNNLDRRKR